jgi:hypothetical protein
MATEYTPRNHAQQVQQSVVDSVVSYMTTCRIPADFITPRLVQLALESSYKAQPVFWRALDRATVLRALDTYAPGFRSSLSFVEENAYEILVDRIDFMLDVRFRDELHAEIFLSAPKSKQQSVLRKPFKYLIQQLHARGEVDLAQVLMEERETAPGAALELVKAQRAASAGRPFTTELMQDAMIARDAFIVARPFDRADSEEA